LIPDSSPAVSESMSCILHSSCLTCRRMLVMSQEHHQGIRYATLMHAIFWTQSSGQEMCRRMHACISHILCIWVTPSRLPRQGAKATGACAEPVAWRLLQSLHSSPGGLGRPCSELPGRAHYSTLSLASSLIWSSVLQCSLLQLLCQEELNFERRLPARFRDSGLQREL